MIKNVLVNEKTYEEITRQLGHEPPNIGISQFVEDNQAIVANEKLWTDINNKLHQPILDK